MNKNTYTILSDTNYDGYIHINQILANYLSINNNVIFVDRVLMHQPNLDRIKRIFINKKPTSNKNSKNNDRLIIHKKNILPLTNNPVLDWFIRIINQHNLKGTFSNSLITFAPSPALELYLKKFNKIFYYCVHDSLKQGYNKKIIEYEKSLCENSKIVFCDNEDVLNRLSNGKWSHLSEYKSGESKYVLIPAPIPDEFFNESKNKNYSYDFVYFGSIHHSIDLNILEKITQLGYKLLIISDELDLLKNIDAEIIPATTNMEFLVNKISYCKNIILPYKNNSFMKSVTPAKIYQCMATNKPTFTSNFEISNKYDLLFLDKNGLTKQHIDCLSKKFIPKRDKVTLYKSTIISNKIQFILEDDFSHS